MKAVVGNTPGSSLQGWFQGYTHLGQLQTYGDQLAQREYTKSLDQIEYETATRLTTMNTTTIHQVPWQDSLRPPHDMGPPQATRTLICRCGQTIRLEVGYALPYVRGPRETHHTIPMHRLWELTTKHHDCPEGITTEQMQQPPTETVGTATRVPPGHKWICHHCHNWMDNTQEHNSAKWPLCVRSRYTTMIDGNDQEHDENLQHKTKRAKK